jgi:hypothetical protein
MDAWEVLDAALAAEDPGGVAGAICQAREALGEWQGCAEVAASYGTLDSVTPAPETLVDPYIEAVRGQFWGKEQWKEAEASPYGPAHGDSITESLRVGCYLISWYLAVAPLAGVQEQDFLDEARRGLAWLLVVQRSSGLFPFPDLSDDYQACLPGCQDWRHGYLCQRWRDAWESMGSPPGYYEDGWIIQDFMSGREGGLQFDNGVCGRVMLEGFNTFGDVEYLESARRAGIWASDQPVVCNFNYNGFSAGLLARLAEMDPDGGQEWLEEAMYRARLGVLPGALENGRWFDPHNARIVYHHIMLRDLAYLDQVTDDPWLSAVMEVANRRSVEEIASRGSTSTQIGIRAHLEARRAGYDPGEALGILVNGSLRGSEVVNGSLIYWISEELKSSE